MSTRELNLRDLTNDELVVLADRINHERRRRISVLQPQGPNVRVLAMNNLARAGLTLEEATQKTDEELLAIPNFGRTCLDYVRGHA